MNSQKGITAIILLLGILIVTALVGTGYYIGKESNQSPQITKEPVPTKILLLPTTLSPDSETSSEDIKKVVTQLLTQSGFPMDAKTIITPRPGIPDDWYFEIHQVREDKTLEWATVTIVPRYKKSGAIVATEPTFILAHKVNGLWNAALPTMVEFKRWLQEVPTTFISEEKKANIRLVDPK